MEGRHKVGSVLFPLPLPSFIHMHLAIRLQLAALNQLNCRILSAQSIVINLSLTNLCWRRVLFNGRAVIYIQQYYS